MRLLALTIAAGILAGTPSQAAGPDNTSPLKSRVSTIDLDTCTVVSRHRDGNTWRCTGLPGVPITVAEGDARFFLSFGSRPEARRAAKQTLRPFNTIFEGKRNRATVEWRYVRRHGRDRPYAAILRYFTSNDSGKGQVLAVIHIGDAESCHVAWIDAVANVDAIAFARKIADGKARQFDWTRDPEVVGATGRSPM